MVKHVGGDKTEFNDSGSNAEDLPTVIQLAAISTSAPRHPLRDALGRVEDPLSSQYKSAPYTLPSSMMNVPGAPGEERSQRPFIEHPSIRQEISISIPEEEARNNPNQASSDVDAQRGGVNGSLLCSGIVSTALGIGLTQLKDGFGIAGVPFVLAGIACLGLARNRGNAQNQPAAEVVQEPQRTHGRK